MINTKPKHQHTHTNGEAIILKDRAPALANYPHARRHNGLIYISGLSSRQPDNSYKGVTTTSEGVMLDIKEQTYGIFENMKVILERCHASLNDVIDLTVFLVDMKDYNEFNQTYNQFFNAETGPTRTTVAVHQLPNPNLLIEVKAICNDPHFQN